MKTMQPVLGPARTQLEDWERWKNRMAVQFFFDFDKHAKRIEVKTSDAPSGFKYVCWDCKTPNNFWDRLPSKFI